MRTRRVIVLGTIGQIPFAGMAWMELQFLEGLRRLGYDVYYVEDTGTWPYDPKRNAITDDCTYTVNYLARVMGCCGLQDHWAYCDVAQNRRAFGLSGRQLTDLLQQTDCLINVTGATVLREQFMRVPIRVYLDTDPAAPQIKVARGDQFTVDLLSAHTHHFTYGENIGASDCGLPVERFEYQTTRQPIILDWWASTDILPHLRYTTISSWGQTGKDVEWDGEIYKWSKGPEFLKFIDLPRQTGQEFEMALACEDLQVIKLFAGHGWNIVDAIPLTTIDILPYRDYIRRSHGEFTVSKDQYVRMRTGWFSERSACYLAAGRPVITQETGFSKILPTGEGLFSFTSMDDIVEATTTIESDYSGNCRAAYEIARNYFAAEKVLSDMMKKIGL